MSIKLFFKYLLSKDPEDAVVKCFCMSLFASVLSLVIATSSLIISLIILS